MKTASIAFKTLLVISTLLLIATAIWVETKELPPDIKTDTSPFHTFTIDIYNPHSPTVECHFTDEKGLEVIQPYTTTTGRQSNLRRGTITVLHDDPPRIDRVFHNRPTGIDYIFNNKAHYSYQEDLIVHTGSKATRSTTPMGYERWSIKDPKDIKEFKRY